MSREHRHTWLRALGSRELPDSIEIGGQSYQRLRTYKHDFFAATGLYGGPSGRIILKLGRCEPLFGLPTAWLGEWLADRETRLYIAAQGLAGIPRCCGRIGRTGFAHEFVPGHPLQRDERVADDFFPALGRLLGALHARGIAYVDLEKRENILVDEQGRPWLIDFQISWQDPDGMAAVPARLGPDCLLRLLPSWLRRLILGRLQDADRYHLLKHRRRHRPDTLSEHELARSYTVGPLIRLHRRLFRPLTLLRRAALKRLTGRSRSAKQDGAEFLSADGREQPAGPLETSHGSSPA